MTTTRRRFIQFAGVGLGLALVDLEVGAAQAPARGADVASGVVDARGLAQPFLVIAPDDTVTVLCKHLEMGQGIWSGLASIVAEELDASIDQIRVLGAPADAMLYKNTLIGFQTTGGSTSIANSWSQLRQAGATARAMLVTAAAARWNVAPETIEVANGSVTCRDRRRAVRKATFGDLAHEAGRVPVPKDVALKEPSRFRYLGKGFPRLDTRAKTTGRTIFAIDMQRPGQRIAMVVRSPRFGGRVVSHDASEALRIDGIVEVVQVPSGVAVIGTSTWAVLKARKLVKVEWDDAKAETRSSAELFDTYRALAKEDDPTFAEVRGDPASAFTNAARTLEAEFVFPYLAHAPMETLCAVGELTGSGDDRVCTIWGGIQNQGFDHKAVGRILGLPLERVDLRTIEAGGSFGRRASFDSDWVGEVAEILKATDGRYPVKVMRTREDDIRGGYYRPASLHTIRAALDSDGAIVAWEQRIVVQSFLFPAGPRGSKGKKDPTAVEGTGIDRYDIPNTRLAWTNPQVGVPVQTFRALAFNHTTTTKEIFIDDLARLSDADPLAFRLRHMATRPRMAAVLRLAAERAGWSATRHDDEAQGLAVQESEKTFVAVVAHLRRVDDRIVVDRLTCAVDCGFVLNPDIVRAQIEGGLQFDLGNALHGKIELDRGYVVQGNFNDYPALRIDETAKRIEVHLIKSTEPPTGVGEPGSVAVTAAVSNALARLTGQSVRRFPISIEDA